MNSVLTFLSIIFLAALAGAFFSTYTMHSLVRFWIFVWSWLFAGSGLNLKEITSTQTLSRSPPPADGFWLWKDHTSSHRNLSGLKGSCRISTADARNLLLPTTSFVAGFLFVVSRFFSFVQTERTKNCAACFWNRNWTELICSQFAKTSAVLSGFLKRNFVLRNVCAPNKATAKKCLKSLNRPGRSHRSDRTEENPNAASRAANYGVGCADRITRNTASKNSVTLNPAKKASVTYCRNIVLGFPHLRQTWPMARSSRCRPGHPQVRPFLARLHPNFLSHCRLHLLSRHPLAVLKKNCKCGGWKS